MLSSNLLKWNALNWYEAKLDFADALHLAFAKTSFATFDEKLVKRASQLVTNCDLILLKTKIFNSLRRVNKRSVIHQIEAK